MLIRSVLLLLLAAPLSPADETDGKPFWLDARGSPSDWTESLLVWNQSRALLVFDTPARTNLRAVFPPHPFAREPVEMTRHVRELLEISKIGKDPALTIDWLDGIPANEAFRRAFLVHDGRVRSVSRIGATTITRTVLGSRETSAVFIHLMADQPGALTFKVTLETGLEGHVRRVDRRQLILTPPAGPASHVWVLPFESDVAPDGDSIVVRGEGEALILWSLAATGAAPDALAELARRHDPGQAHPDPGRIWQGVLAGHLHSAENSP